MLVFRSWLLLLNDINAIVEDCDNEDLDLPVPCSCHNLPLGNCPSNISNTINLIKQVTSSGVPNRDNVQHQVGPLNIPAWEERLQEYWDKEDVLAGNTFGWELGTETEPVPVSTYKNHSSAYNFSDSVDIIGTRYTLK